MQRYEGVREYFSRVLEVLVVKMVKFGERGVKHGEMPLEIGAQI